MSGDQASGALSPRSMTAADAISDRVTSSAEIAKTLAVEKTHARSPAAPPAAVSGGPAHGRSPGSLRLAGAAFPGSLDPVANARRHAAYSRGGGRGSAEGLPHSLFTLESEGPCRDCCFRFKGGCQTSRCEALTATMTTYQLCRSRKFEPLQKIQVFLRDDQKAALKSLTMRTGARQSELVRRAVDLLLEERTRKDPDWREATRAVAGVWRDHEDPEAAVAELRKATRRRFPRICDRS